MYFTPCCSVSIVNFEQVKAGWEKNLIVDSTSKLVEQEWIHSVRKTVFEFMFSTITQA